MTANKEPMQEYKARACLRCGKPIPRWMNGKQTRPNQLFHSEACGQAHRRMHRYEARASSRKKAPAAQRLLKPKPATEARWDIGRCAHCDSGFVRMSPDQRYCSKRCEDYVPLPPRNVKGPWYIVAGPVDFCEECGFAIVPRPPHGLVTGYRGLDRVFRCLECHDARYPRRTSPANDNSEIEAKIGKAA